MHSRQALALPALAAAALALPATAAASRLRREPRKDVTVVSGQTLQVPATTSFDGTLTVQDGGTIAVPTGDSLTLTVNGIETGQALTQTGGAVTAVVPGIYRGHITLPVAAQNPIAWQGLTFPFRQVLYVDGNGVDLGKSVISAVHGGRVSDSTACDFGIASNQRAAPRPGERARRMGTVVGERRGGDRLSPGAQGPRRRLRQRPASPSHRCDGTL